MPAVAWAVASYAAGLLAGFNLTPASPAAFALVAIASIAAFLPRWRSALPIACALLGATGVLVAREARRADEDCVRQASQSRTWTAARVRTPCAALAAAGTDSGTFARWRVRAGKDIDTLFGPQAPVVRALLIADTRTLPADVRDRFAAAGLVHILSISGLHVAIVAEAVLLALQAARIPRSPARWAALGVTALYVAAIGAPAPALRSAAMLGVATCSRTFQRPVSPWASLALGAAIPLVDPRSVIDLGWQLSVAGFAALAAAGIWCKRRIPVRIRGWRRSLLRDLAVSCLATLVTAPLVAWSFGRVSLIAPLTNIAAAPVIAILQPSLFLAVVIAPWHGPAAFAASASRPLLAALDGVARVGSSVPGAALSVAPSIWVAVSSGVAALAILVAASSRRPGHALVAAAFALAACCWWPLVPIGSGEVELHVLDVGQGDAIALRTPHGRWILVDAGRTWPGGDAGRSVVVPYVRRLGGDVALFILSHPHADHVGGATTVLRTLHPGGYRDAAFAGGSGPYRNSLSAATELGVPWARVHPGDALQIDDVSVEFLAPDSAWIGHLTDPNLASSIVRVRYGDVRFLLTGDAEAPEESWLLAHEPDALGADVLKVAHHGSATSSTPRFLDRVRPRVAIVSVGAGNAYGHPSADVMRALLGYGATVLRTDQFGTIVVRTDGHELVVRAAGVEWAIARPPR
jgi:competence protein ComEC